MAAESSSGDPVEGKSEDADTDRPISQGSDRHFSQRSRAWNLCNRVLEKSRYGFIPGAGVTLKCTSAAAFVGQARQLDIAEDEERDPFDSGSGTSVRFFAADTLNFPEPRRYPGQDERAWRCGSACSPGHTDVSGACCAWMRPSRKHASVRRVSCIMSSSGSARSGMGFTEPSCEVGELPIRVVGSENARGPAKRILDSLANAAAVDPALGEGLLSVYEEVLPHPSWSSVRQAMSATCSKASTKNAIRELPRITRASPAAHWSLASIPREARQLSEISSASSRARGFHNTYPFAILETSEHCDFERTDTGEIEELSDQFLEDYKATLRSLLRGQKLYDDALKLLSYSTISNADFYVRRSGEAQEAARFRNAVATYLKTGRNLASCPGVYTRFVKLVRDVEASPGWMDDVASLVNDHRDEVEDSRSSCKDQFDPLAYAETAARVILGGEAALFDSIRGILRPRLALYEELCYVGFALFQAYGTSSVSTRNSIYVRMRSKANVSLLKSEIDSLWGSCTGAEENVTVAIFGRVVGENHEFIPNESGEIVVPPWIRVLVPFSSHEIVTSEGSGHSLTSTQSGSMISTFEKTTLVFTRHPSIELLYSPTASNTVAEWVGNPDVSTGCVWSAVESLLILPWTVGDPEFEDSLAEGFGPMGKRVVAASRASYNSDFDRASVSFSRKGRGKGTPARADRQAL